MVLIFVFMLQFTFYYFCYYAQLYFKENVSNRSINFFVIVNKNIVAVTFILLKLKLLISDVTLLFKLIGQDFLLTFVESVCVVSKNFILLPSIKPNELMFTLSFIFEH